MPSRKLLLTANTKKARLCFLQGGLFVSKALKAGLVIHLGAVTGRWAGRAFFSGISQIIASVVSIRALIEAAFCRAERVTLVGSMTPDCHQVFVAAGGGVEAEVGVVVGPDLLDHDGAFVAGVARRSGEPALRMAGG